MREKGRNRTEAVCMLQFSSVELIKNVIAAHMHVEAFGLDKIFFGPKMFPSIILYSFKFPD